MVLKYVEKSDMKDFKKIDTTSWDSLKNNVFARLINQKFLSNYENVAYIKFLDLALTFSVQEKLQGTLLSHLLTEEEIKSFDIKLDEVIQMALENTTHDRKRRILTYKESNIKNNTLYPILQMPENTVFGVGQSKNDYGIIQDIDEGTGMENILILCNKYDVLGASYIASFDILKEIYERFGENFYIIPLSIHKVMCVRSGYATHEEEKSFAEVDDDFLDMIEDYNDKYNKSCKDILSYKIYYYYGCENRLMLCTRKE